MSQAATIDRSVLTNEVNGCETSTPLPEGDRVSGGLYDVTFPGVRGRAPWEWPKMTYVAPLLSTGRSKSVMRVVVGDGETAERRPRSAAEVDRTHRGGRRVKAEQAAAQQRGGSSEEWTLQRVRGVVDDCKDRKPCSSVSRLILTQFEHNI